MGVRQTELSLNNIMAISCKTLLSFVQNQNANALKKKSQLRNMKGDAPTLMTEGGAL